MNLNRLERIMNSVNRLSPEHDAACILEQAARDFFIGIIGNGPGFESILELMGHPELEDVFPRLHLVACADSNIPPELLGKINTLGTVQHETFREMLQAHPEINLLIELTNQPELLRDLRHFVSPDISILDHTSAVFLCGLLIMSEMSSKCKVDLVGHQSLLHTVMDEMNDDVFFLDANGLVLDVNKHVCKRLGKERDDLLQKPCWEVASGTHQSRCTTDDPDCPLSTTLAEGREAESLHTWVDPEGRAHYCQIRTYPIFNQKGDVHKVIEVRKDVTLRTEMEKRLQQAEKLAAIGELSTYIAHEIRNPLFAIGGFANALLRAPDLAAGAREKVRIILEESKRLDNILKSIINFARPTTAASSEVDVNTVILETMQLLGIGCKERGVAMDIQLSEDAARVRGDAELLKQCLINIVKNALEAMSEGGILTVSSGMESHSVRVTVKDTGVGIPIEAQDMIFNPFYTTKKTGGGSGLGLAMTKKIIGDLGGFLRLESQVGFGTTVTMLLPPYVALQEKE